MRCLLGDQCNTTSTLIQVRLFEFLFRKQEKVARRWELKTALINHKWWSFKWMSGQTADVNSQAKFEVVTARANTENSQPATWWHCVAYSGSFSIRYDKKELLCITKSIRIKLTSLFSDANKSLFEQALQMKIINITNNTDIQSAVKIKTVLLLSVSSKNKKWTCGLKLLPNIAKIDKFNDHAPQLMLLNSLDSTVRLFRV